MNRPTFNTVRRGYDPHAVDDAFERMGQSHSQALQESAEKTVEITRLASELESTYAAADELRNQVGELTEKVTDLEAASSTAFSYADLGPRISSMLTLADEEAEELRQRATTEAETLVADAETEAQRLRTQAEDYSSDTRSQADAEAARILEHARREADEVLDHAEREASAQRREAEALFEQQRAQAAAAAAEFEKTLAARRDKAATEFSTQMDNYERALTTASEKLAAAEEEAAIVLREAMSDAQSERERANSEATQLLDNARIHAERVRRDSERELSALASRRDSITEQLANVRQMLATLGGGAAIALAETDTAISPKTEDSGDPAGTEADAEGESGAVVASDGDGGEPVGDGEGAVELTPVEQE